MKPNVIKFDAAAAEEMRAAGIDVKKSISTVETESPKFKLITRSVEDWFRLHTKAKDQITVHHLKDGVIGLFNERNKMMYLMGAEKKI